MDSHAAVLVSMIETLEQFEKQLDLITASNYRQIAKAREKMSENGKKALPPR